MAEHIYDKSDLIQRFEGILGKTLQEIDDQGMFAHVQAFDRQKGVVGTLIEQCVLGYEPDTKQDPDLIVVEGATRMKTELKSTGLVIRRSPQEHFVAKEPMSITAAGIYDLADQDFASSHFWQKLEHMLIVYYHYAANAPVSPYDYRLFPIKGYEFHEFAPDEVTALEQDWQHVHDFVANIIFRHPGPRTQEWKDEVKQEYIDTHGALRQVLSYIDLAPKFPPRFRLKQPTVSAIIAQHFGYALEQLPGRYIVVSDVDWKCRELTDQYKGMRIGDLAASFHIPIPDTGRENKAVVEQLTVAMFGGSSQKLNQIEMFQRFGLIAKSVTLTPSGGRTEDMKLFHIDFGEIAQTTVIDEEGAVRPMQFEDSMLYAYFADHEFLCILYEEPPKTYEFDPATHKRKEKTHPLAENTFVGFKRLVFSDAFIDGPVRCLWDDLRRKVLGGELRDIVCRRKDGSVVTIGSGEVSSAPNFLKSKDNPVFVRGSGEDSSLKNKAECVNGIRMLPQYVWLKGTAVVDELNKVPEI